MKSQKRKFKAFSVVEVLVAAVLFVTSMAVISQLISLIIQASQITKTRVEGIDAARTAVHRIMTDVRQARNVGDLYGVEDKRSFPAPENPMYGNSPTVTTPLVGTFPGAPWKRMTLSDDVLILQIPVFRTAPPAPSAFPVPLEAPSTPPAGLPNVDTVVYEVIEDLERAGEYQLQVVRFPGQLSTTPTILPPQIILKGLVGPLKNGKPSIFGYLERRNQNKGGYEAALTDISSVKLGAQFVRGIVVELDIKNTVNGQGSPKYAQFNAVHSEAIMKNYSP